MNPYVTLLNGIKYYIDANSNDPERAVQSLVDNGIIDLYTDITDYIFLANSNTLYL